MQSFFLNYFTLFVLGSNVLINKLINDYLSCENKATTT